MRIAVSELSAKETKLSALFWNVWNFIRAYFELQLFILDGIATLNLNKNGTISYYNLLYSILKRSLLKFSLLKKKIYKKKVNTFFSLVLLISWTELIKLIFFKHFCNPKYLSLNGK